MQRVKRYHEKLQKNYKFKKRDFFCNFRKLVLFCALFLDY